MDIMHYNFIKALWTLECIYDIQWDINSDWNCIMTTPKGDLLFTAHVSVLVLTYCMI